MQPAASQFEKPREGEAPLTQKEENAQLPEKEKAGEVGVEKGPETFPKENGPREGYAGGVVFRIKSLKKAPSPGNEPASGTGAKAGEVAHAGEDPEFQGTDTERHENPPTAEARVETAGLIETAPDREEAEKDPNPGNPVMPVEGEMMTGGPIREASPVAAPEKTVKSKRGRKSLKQATAEADLIEIPVDEVLFRKQYYTMGEVAEMFRVNQSLLRFWETEFHMLKPRKNKKGDRYFRPADIKSLHLIYHLLRQRKYTIEGAKEFLKNNKKSEDRFDAIQRLQAVKAFLLEWKAQL